MSDRLASRLLVQLRINGEEHRVETWPMQRLLDLLRHQAGMNGVKEGCGEGECGACAVLLNGELVNSCLVPAAQAEGAAVTTIEGLAGADGRLHAIQRAFVEHGGAQCGFCTPGMIMAAFSLLRRNPKPGEAEIREGLAGNICRCTGYTRIFESVVMAMRNGEQP